MKNHASVVAACAVALLICVTFTVRLHAVGSLAAARDLYASAAYDDALTMLDGLTSATKALDERQSIDLYRTLCLVALGRTSDADRAIEAMIQRDPLYRASADELSPRLRSTIADVRKRMLPSIIQQKYADAKAAFDTQDYPVAAAGFGEVLKGVADPDISALAGAPPLSDLRTLAAGFRDLSVRFTPPPVAPPEPPPARPVRSVYSAADTDVIPPVAIQQKVPKFPGTVVRPAVGMIEFVVDEAGAVQSEMMRVPIEPTFDRLVLSAAAKWQYQPATLDGKPVKYLKRFSINVSPTAQ